MARQALGASKLVIGGGYEAQTAGTTQTQAGATALTKGNVAVTTGNASDGVALPRGDSPSDIGMEVVICNLSAVALKVYPYKAAASSATDLTQEDRTAYGGTVDGGAANAALTHAASATRKYILTAANTWKSILL